MNGKFLISILASVFALGIVVDTSARPFDRFRQRRNPGTHTDDGNIPHNAPPAPPSLTDSPAPVNVQCPPGGCPTVPGVPQVPSMVQQPLQYLQIPKAQVVTRTLVPRVVESIRLSPDTRVDALLSALEQRLGIKPQAAVTGNPNSLFGKLPKVKVQLKTQGDEVVDEVEIDLKTYILEKLTE